MVGTWCKNPETREQIAFYGDLNYILHLKNQSKQWVKWPGILSLCQSSAALFLARASYTYKVPWVVCGSVRAGYRWVNGKKTLRANVFSCFEALLKTYFKSLWGFWLSFTLAWSSDTAKRCRLAYSFLLPASQHEVWYQSSTISVTSAEAPSADK